MKNKLPWVLVIVLALILVWVLFLKPEYNPATDAPSNSEESVQQEAFMAEESKWAHAENDLPKGWVRWTDTLIEIPVEKYGPSRENPSYIVKLQAGMRDGLSEPKQCIGDSEVATCAVGTDPEVLRYFAVLNYYY